MSGRFWFLAAVAVIVVAKTSAVRKPWGRNDNPLLQQHLLIPFTFNTGVEKVDFNRESFQPDSIPKAATKPTLKQLADEYQSIVIDYMLQNMNKNKDSSVDIEKTVSMLPISMIQESVRNGGSRERGGWLFDHSSSFASRRG